MGEEFLNGSNSKLVVDIIKYPKEEDWLFAYGLALATAGKPARDALRDGWKNMILASEHSPIRSLIFSWQWENLPYWVSNHFVRHKIGIEHYVQSQRNDRQKLYNREEAPQKSPVTHRCVANAQAIINISKVRLCRKASPETMSAWKSMLFNLEMVCPEIVQFCKPSCVYRNGICPEPKSCGYNNTQAFLKETAKYKELYG